MDEGNLKELRELVEFLKASGVAEFDMERPELKVRLTFASVEAAPAMAVAPPAALDYAQLAQLLAGSAAAASRMPVPAEVAPVHGVQGVQVAQGFHGGQGASAGPEAVAAAAGGAEAIDEDAGLHMVKSPLVGTYYDAAAPGAEPFAKVGDRVAVGKVLCIVEAMKIMNEIESDVAGEVVKVFVNTAQPVEYGQRLFAVKM